MRLEWVQRTLYPQDPEMTWVAQNLDSNRGLLKALPGLSH